MDTERKCYDSDLTFWRAGTATGTAPLKHQMRRDSGPIPRRLYHAVSIEENQEFNDSNIYMQNNNADYQNSKDHGGIARMSSASMVGIRAFLETYPSKPFEADVAAPIQRGPIGGGKSGLQGWDSDLLDLPIGEGGPTSKRKLCILSMDGGGIRGLIAARILMRLEVLILVDNILEPTTLLQPLRQEERTRKP